MGQNNRQRRAAKQRQRAQQQHAQQQRAHQAGGDTQREREHEVFASGAAALLLGRIVRRRLHGDKAVLDLLDFRRCAEEHQHAAVDAQVTSAVNHLIAAGWTPLDLSEVLLRKAPSQAAGHLLDIVAESTARHPAHLVHPRWRAQLDQLGAVAPQTGGLSRCAGWGRRSGLEWASAFEQLLAVLVVVLALPSVTPVIPAPGSRGDAVAEADGIDAKVLRRVRGLLAKAESTEHPEEADALTSKAQELMTRYSIERAVAESAAPGSRVPVSRRLWLENPYVDAKALLVEVVSEANNCTSVQSSTWGYVTVVGHGTDLDVVELLVTSLLVQATRAVTLAGPQVTRYGTSRTRSFRQSFLVAYAQRIGERLRESSVATETTYDSHHGGALVPVLAARREAVHDRVTEMFPQLTERRVSASDAAGWGAGRAAADLALFDVRDSLTSRAG